MRPIFRTGHQAGADRILPDIVSLKLKSFIRSDAMIEIIALPIDLMSSCGETLPAADNFRQVLRSRKPGNHMEVVRHEQEDEQDPASLPVIECRILDQAGRSVRSAELIVSPGLAADGNKKPGIPDRDGRDVLQCLPRVWHPRILSRRRLRATAPTTCGQAADSTGAYFRSGTTRVASFRPIVKSDVLSVSSFR